MFMIETLTAFGTVGAAFAAVWAIRQNRLQQEINGKAINLDAVLRLSELYDKHKYEWIESRSPDALVRLFAREFWLYEIGFLDKKVWNAFERYILQDFKEERIRSAYIEMKKNAQLDECFVRWVDNSIKEIETK